MPTTSRTLLIIILLAPLIGCRSERVAFTFEQPPVTLGAGTISSTVPPVPLQLFVKDTNVLVATPNKSNVQQATSNRRHLARLPRHHRLVASTKLTRHIVQFHERPQANTQDKKADDFAIAILLFLLACVGGILFLIGAITSSPTTLLIGISMGIIFLFSFLLFTDWI